MLSRLRSAFGREAIRSTFGYYMLFICLGLDMAMTGPTLPALASQTGSRLAQMGLLFLASSAGYTLGTLISGRVYDRARGHPVMGMAQLAVAGLLVLVPLAPWLWVLLAILMLKGLAEGFINTGASILLVWTHGEKVAPFMNGLHFSFGLGAFLSPLVVAQLLGTPGGYRWGFWILAGITALAGLRMLSMAGNPRPAQVQAGGTSRVPGGRTPIPLIMLTMAFLFFYVGAEITFSGWVYTYAVTLQLASISGAAYLTSMFWLAFTLGRLASIPAATRFKPRQVILVALLSCLVILAVGMLFSNSSVALWLMAAGLGLCMAPIYANGFTLAGQSIDLNGRIASIILLGDSLGGMVMPSAVGAVIESAGPRAMVSLIFGSLVLNLLAFVGMLRLRPAKVAERAAVP